MPFHFKFNREGFFLLTLIIQSFIERLNSDGRVRILRRSNYINKSYMLMKYFFAIHELGSNSILFLMIFNFLDNFLYHQRFWLLHEYKEILTHWAYLWAYNQPHLVKDTGQRSNKCSTSLKLVEYYWKMLL